MKKYLFNIFHCYYNNFLDVFLCSGSNGSHTADQGKTRLLRETGYLENVILEKLPGKERIALVVSLQPLVSVESQTDGSLLD